MSDQQLTDQPPQAKTKHAGGRPRKPKPVPPLPPPARHSLEETLDMGDKAALEASAAAQLRWSSVRVQLVKDIQARKDAACTDALETDNKHLRERVEAVEKAKQHLENELGKKDRDLVEARTENDKMATNLQEMADEHAKLSLESTNNARAAEKKAKGLLAVVRCVCLQMKQHSEGQRIEYAARLMDFHEQAVKRAQKLAELVRNPEAHREHHAARYRNLPQGPIEPKLNSAQFAQILTSQEQAIERSMQSDRERLGIEVSNFIPDEVMNQAFELLGVTREQVVEHLDTEQQDRKA
jgi:hypothetical protein